VKINSVVRDVLCFSFVSSESNVKSCLSSVHSDITVELPLVLMSPKPAGEISVLSLSEMRILCVCVCVCVYMYTAQFSILYRL